MKNNVVITFIVFILILANSGLTQAQPSSSVGMLDNPCPEQTSGGAPPEYLKAMMEPGAKMPPFPKPDDPAFQAMMKSRAASRERDFAELCRFKKENAQLINKQTNVVFMGDSITAGWSAGDTTLFSDGMVNRGIGGQTSPQMLLRFYQDVIALNPTVVHIMAGTNDLAGNTGPNSPEDFKNNIRAMVDLAKANNIQVILASILPVTSFAWQPGSNPEPQITQLNSWLKQFSEQHNLVYADYYAVTVTDKGKFNPKLSNDGVHPHRVGYEVMRPIVNEALRNAMDK